MSELQAALKEYDEKGRGLNVLPAETMKPIVDAARLVANPNIEAARNIVSWKMWDAPWDELDDGMRVYVIEVVQKTLAAALTPGDTDE